MEKVWLKSYPPGVPAEINADACESIVDMFEQSIALYSKSPAFYNLGVTITYQQLDHYSKAFANYLLKVLHLIKGDRVALMMPNILQYPVAMLGVLRAGLIVVNVNPLYTVPELVEQINHAGVETIVVMDNFAGIVQTALPQTSIKNVILTQIGDLFPRPRALLIHFYLKYIKKKIPALQMPTLSFRKAISQGEAFSFEKVLVNRNDIAFLQFTGGTTGIAKGAILTHRNLIANIMQIEAWFSNILQLQSEIAITALPLYHIFSLSANCLFIAKIGGLSVLITNPRDIPGLVKEMRQFKFTMVTAVNTLFNGLLNYPQFSALNFNQMKVSLGGGMSVQRAVAEKWQEVTGKPILEAYGLTETSPCVTINLPDLKAYNGTVGLPVPSTDVIILDDDGKALDFNQPGELGVKGPQVMQGYWNHVDETKKVFNKDGWLLTGDIASIDPQGFVRILERKKDMIIVSGFNVYPNEIEDVLVHMPGIREAAVVGVANGPAGEAVKAFIVKDHQHAELTAEEVIKFCRNNLTGYKIPKYIEFCPELPKSYVGKILRRALK